VSRQMRIGPVRLLTGAGSAPQRPFPGHWTCAALAAYGRLELLRPMGMQPASSIIKDRQTSFFNGDPVRTSQCFYRSPKRACGQEV
jgi:hypothetical protein